MDTSGNSSGWRRQPQSAAPKRSRKPWPTSRHKTEEARMPINPHSNIEITAYQWVPDFAQGLVRDLRVRWALEEAGLDYRVRLLDVQHKPADYVKEQPFEQVPCFSDGIVHIFESGAIVQYIGDKSEAL